MQAHIESFTALCDSLGEASSLEALRGNLLHALNNNSSFKASPRSGVRTLGALKQAALEQDAEWYIEVFGGLESQSKITLLLRHLSTADSHIAARADVSTLLLGLDMAVALAACERWGCDERYRSVLHCMLQADLCAIADYRDQARALFLGALQGNAEAGTVWQLLRRVGAEVVLSSA